MFVFILFALGIISVLVAQGLRSFITNKWDVYFYLLPYNLGMLIMGFISFYNS